MFSVLIAALTAINLQS